MEKTSFNKAMTFEDRWEVKKDMNGNEVFIRSRIPYEDKEQFALT